ncbi:hypothetical protein [Ancylobacter terrae]|uniref:hypothetical protein n=1 Tax=Ancylobacter sp. sgz301288 TaxID=3342077 RepID=UPI00385A51F8
MVRILLLVIFALLSTVSLVSAKSGDSIGPRSVKLQRELKSAIASLRQKVTKVAPAVEKRDETFVVLALRVLAQFDKVPHTGDNPNFDRLNDKHWALVRDVMVCANEKFDFSFGILSTVGENLEENLKLWKSAKSEKDRIIGAGRLLYPIDYVCADELYNTSPAQ